jgi:hypothetical protein
LILMKIIVLDGNENQAVAPPYRVGARRRRPRGDFRRLIEVWRGAPAAFPGDFPN